ncbi:PP2C-domain-containing protein [Rhizodiscina lignyota]|uniref:Adenylate cyclase n=1 Tax=Rhizodiscina lignyota TaxID=1504668 RepID=A0A9P4M8F0_9PEZI|nr:PP2C-domain-containing protein [Rhizodiscina lignyota]
MTKNENSAARHGSTASSDSWRSNDTIRPSSFGLQRRGTPVKVKTEKDSQQQQDLEVSPSSTAPTTKSRDAIPASIAPWEHVGKPDFINYRKDLRALETSGRSIPSISKQPPTAISPNNPPWAQNPPVVMPTSVFGSFFNDSSEDVSLSPGFRPGSSQYGDGQYVGEDRRPSVASATTVSSTGSKSSVGRNFHKKLQGFFGEDFPGTDSRQNSDVSLPPDARLDAHRDQARKRNNSVNDARSRPGSPASFSRPRTPMASSEVTPWEFQDSKDLPAPPAIPENLRDRASTKAHRLHLPGHRHTKSKDEPKTSDYGSTIPLRPSMSREDSASSRRTEQTLNAMSSATSSRTGLNAPRPSSPTPSSNSAMSRMAAAAQRSPDAANSGGKRSLLDKITRRGKGDKPETLKDLPSSSVSLQSRPNKIPSAELSPGPTKKRSIPPTEGLPRGNGHISSRDGTSKKEHGRLPFKGQKKGHGGELVQPKDPNEFGRQSEKTGGLWNLDTDLSHMEGIVNAQQPPMTPPPGEIYTGWPNNEKPQEPKEQPEGPAGSWDAPDSWGVRRVGDDVMGKLKLLDDRGMLEENSGPPYCIRIFRSDSTFATLSVGLYTTVAEIIQTLGKKTALSDDIDSYHILMRKHDTSRQLEPQERPLLIQKQLLMQAGYTDSDRIEDIGREDNSYLCRFTFLPAKMTGYASFEKDPGFNKQQKLSHVDLQGRNLITIPITLYQKATDIIFLNLSRNLNLDVPTDFIQACTNLREIKYTGNEAWRLPRSLSLASRLSILDISNNRLEQLDHADLNKLQSLQAIRMSNNKLSRLPSHFGQFKFMRSLNVSSNSLTEFPEFLSDLKTLVDLDISFNSISSLPSIGNLTNLERLWATNNKLSGSLPDSMKNLVNLNNIDIRFNAITNIDILAQLPKLDHVDVGHNSISAFEGAFPKIRKFQINHNPVTRFGFTEAIPTLLILDLKGAKLAQLPDDLYGKMPNLTKLHLDKNHFGAVSPQIGRLAKLEHLSIARNDLSSLPGEIGRLGELRYLDVRENNLNSLPAEIWWARKLETLNVSSNVLVSFPKPGAPMPNLPSTTESTPVSTPGTNTHHNFEELGRLEDFAARRPSQASGYLSVGSSPGASTRKGSMSSGHTASGRKPSVISRTTEGTITPISRKDSSISSRLATTFAGSLRHLLLADNRLSDDVFDELALLPELRILNLSYNYLIDVPPRTLRRWQHLTELYLSGNDLSSLPAEELEEISSLKVLLINSNKFQVLPAELAKVQKLAIMDVASNLLKYNVSNWPYDWNWNWNHNLKYLNMSGNKRLEIKPSGQAVGRGGKDLTDFTSLTKLRVLGLMDVTLMVPSVPDQTEDRRVRTAGSTVGSMAYGMADSLGRNEHLSTMDMVVPRFRSHDDETIVGMFDGQSLTSGGSKIARFLYENFKHRFAEELERLRPQDNPQDALRRSYLGLNKDLATAASHGQEKGMNGTTSMGHRPSIAMPELTEDDLQSGSVATVLFLKDMELFVSNIGDAQALLIHSEGGHRIITRKHDPAEASERARIRDAGGYVSRLGKLNDSLEVSRAFGYFRMAPAVIAAPHVSQITIRESDEMVLLASRELWDYLTPDFAVDVARSERGDLMRAAQKLRDLAIAFGATGKIMVMMIGVSDLRRRERARFRTHSMSMGPTGEKDEIFASATRRGKRGRDAVADSKLARLDQEVDAPTGDVSLVFTDIKNSTILWETYPIAMRSAIRMHNEVMRRHLRIIGGYEVKTEGDAFMVAFPTVTSALLWCFTIQSQLLDVAWPQEILSSIHGQEVMDSDNNVIFRGLSVRMGIHWGQPVCEVDPVTKRMDYFGPMVNRASRISSVADGGQITVSSDFIAEIQRLLETHIESDRSGSTGSEDTLHDDMINQAIRRELRSLSSQGFEVKDLGERRLKGLENPEYIYLMYPHSLASRLVIQQQRAEAEAQAQESGAAAAKMTNSQLSIDTQNVWDLWNVSLRLEMLCSTLESTGVAELKPPETQLLERMKNNGGEITDRFLLNFVEHQISRIETCTTTLALRNLVRPFNAGMLSQACPMQDIFGELHANMQELSALRDAAADADFELAPA